jgi:hypothetical protein
MLLDNLARLELSRQPLSAMIQRMVTNPRRDAHNILITPRLGTEEAARLKVLLRTGVSILVVALIWDEEAEQSETLATAAALGCQVVGVHPGQDLSTALYQDIGAGNRL